MHLFDTLQFLESIETELNLKSAMFVHEKTKFYLLLVNSDNKQKEVHFGEADLTKDPLIVKQEIIDGVNAQGW